MGMGDNLLAAGQAKRLHEQTGKPVAIVSAQGHVRYDPLWAGLPYIVNPNFRMPPDRVYLSNYVGNRPYFHPPFTAEGGWKWTGWRACEHPPQLALTGPEKALGDHWRGKLGRYVVFEPHAQNDSTPNKLWGLERWQALLPLLNDARPLQVGSAWRTTLPGAHRAITHDFRQACGVLSGAAAYVGTDGGLMHAAKALGIPGVIIWGGCTSLFNLGYPENVNLVSPREGTPCGRYLPCDHCKAAMADITPQMVATGLTELLNKREEGAA